MLGDNLRALRKNKEMTLQELSDDLNDQYPGAMNFNKGKLSKWENNVDTPYLSSAQIMADYFNVTVDDLIGGSFSANNIAVIYNNLTELNQSKIYNYASDLLNEQKKALNNPLKYGDDMIQEESGSYIPEGAEKALYVKGNSMEPLIKDGSIVFYREQANIENGEIAIVEIQGEAVTCKKVKYDFENQKIILQSINDKYNDLTFNDYEIRILGKLIQ